MRLHRFHDFKDHFGCRTGACHAVIGWHSQSWFSIWHCFRYQTRWRGRGLHARPIRRTSTSWKLCRFQITHLWIPLSDERPSNFNQSSDMSGEPVTLWGWQIKWWWYADLRKRSKQWNRNKNHPSCGERWEWTVWESYRKAKLPKGVVWPFWCYLNLKTLPKL